MVRLHVRFHNGCRLLTVDRGSTSASKPATNPQNLAPRKPSLVSRTRVDSLCTVGLPLSWQVNSDLGHLTATATRQVVFRYVMGMDCVLNLIVCLFFFLLIISYVALSTLAQAFSTLCGVRCNGVIKRHETTTITKMALVERGILRHRRCSVILVKRIKRVINLARCS